MAVDQKTLAFIVALLGMAGQVDLADLREREIRQIIERRIAVVRR